MFQVVNCPVSFPVVETLTGIVAVVYVVLIGASTVNETVYVSEV